MEPPLLRQSNCRSGERRQVTASLLSEWTPARALPRGLSPPRAVTGSTRRQPAEPKASQLPRPASCLCSPALSSQFPRLRDGRCKNKQCFQCRAAPAASDTARPLAWPGPAPQEPRSPPLCRSLGPVSLPRLPHRSSNLAIQRAGLGGQPQQRPHTTRHTASSMTSSTCKKLMRSSSAPHPHRKAPLSE